MSSATRIRIAALATALFIGALSVAGLAVRADHRQQSAAAPTTAASSPTASAPSFTFEELGDD